MPQGNTRLHAHYIYSGSTNMTPSYCTTVHRQLLLDLHTFPHVKQQLIITGFDDPSFICINIYNREIESLASSRSLAKGVKLKHDNIIL